MTVPLFLDKVSFRVAGFGENSSYEVIEALLSANTLSCKNLLARHVSESKCKVIRPSLASPHAAS